MSTEIQIYNPDTLGPPMGQYHHVTRVKATEYLFIAGMLAGDKDGNVIGERDFDVLVNTTSVGLNSDESPIPASAHREGSTVLDAVYQPERTRLLAEAEAAGATPIGGKWMLVHQAAEQLRLWTGREAPIDAMAEAFDRAGRS